MDELESVADVERIIGDTQTGAVTLDDRAAFGFALDADDVEIGPQSGGFEPHGTASRPDVPQRAPCRKPQPRQDHRPHIGGGNQVVLAFIVFFREPKGEYRRGDAVGYGGIAVNAGIGTRIVSNPGDGMRDTVPKVREQKQDGRGAAFRAGQIRQRA